MDLEFQRKSKSSKILRYLYISLSVVSYTRLTFHTLLNHKEMAHPIWDYIPGISEKSRRTFAILMYKWTDTTDINHQVIHENHYIIYPGGVLE